MQELPSGAVGQLVNGDLGVGANVGSDDRTSGDLGRAIGGNVHVTRDLADNLTDTDLFRCVVGDINDWQHVGASRIGVRRQVGDFDDFYVVHAEECGVFLYCQFMTDQARSTIVKPLW